MIAAGVLTLSLGAFALAGCGVSGEEYTFEAENATFEGTGLVMGMTPGPATISQESAYMVNGELVADKTLVGVENFNGSGQKIIWKVNAPKACKAEITLHAASAAMYTNMPEDGDWTKASTGLSEINFTSSSLHKFSVNGTEAKLKGTLPGIVFDNQTVSMQTPGVWWNMGTAKAVVNLKEGENTIVLEIGTLEQGQSAGLNVDKIVIKAPAELTKA